MPSVDLFQLTLIFVVGIQLRLRQWKTLFNIDAEVYITFYNLFFYNIINFFKIIIGNIEITIG